MIQIIKNNFNIPNVLTLSRIPLAILFLILFIILPENYVNNLILLSILLISILTDILDGMIARKFNLITNFGILADAGADKIVQLIVIICFGFKNDQLFLPIVIFITLELSLIISSVIIALKKNRFADSNNIGKVSTCIFYVAIFAMLLLNINQVLIYSIIVLSAIIKFLSYVYRYYKLKGEV